MHNAHVVDSAELSRGARPEKPKKNSAKPGDKVADSATTAGKPASTRPDEAAKSALPAKHTLASANSTSTARSGKAPPPVEGSTAINRDNILPVGSKRARGPPPPRLINQLIENNRSLFLEDIPDDELFAAIVDSDVDDDEDGEEEDEEEDEDAEDGGEEDSDFVPGTTTSEDSDEYDSATNTEDFTPSSEEEETEEETEEEEEEEDHEKEAARKKPQPP